MKEVIERYCVAFTNGDLAALDDLVAPDVIDHSAYDGQPEGIAGYREFSQLWKTAFPDLEITLHDTIEEGDRVAYRFTLSGTHRGTFHGIEPTGRRITLDAMSIARIVGGRIVEEWFMTDGAKLLDQIREGEPRPTT